MLKKKSSPKTPRTKGLARLKTPAELNTQIKYSRVSEPEGFGSKSYPSATQVRSYRNSYPDGPLGSYPGL